MKKVYEKPMLAVEYYQLTQTIAACETKISMLNSECVINDSDSTDIMKDLAWGGWFADASNCYHTNASASFAS